MFIKLADSEYKEANKKEVSLIAMLMLLQEMGVAPTLLLIIVVNILTGLSIHGPAQLMEYFEKSLSEGEVITMAGKCTVLTGDEFKDFEKEARELFDAMKGMMNER